jgi:SAM-dependent methyltransferase
MPPIVNTHHAEAWNGWEGDLWARNPDRYDGMMGGVNDGLLGAAAIGSSERVLDVGCGTGQTTLLAARRAANGRVIGIDLSAAMLERARASAAAQGLAHVEFIQGDAQVHPLRSDGYDVAISRSGMSLFADPVAAFANLARALHPGGRLAFTGPGPPNPGSDLARATAAVRPLLRRPSPAQQGMGSLTDPERIRAVLAAAGFVEVTTTPVDCAVVLGRDAADAAEFLFATGPYRYNLDGVAGEVVARARADVEWALRAHETPEGVRLRRVDWLVTAMRRVRTAAISTGCGDDRG